MITAKDMYGMKLFQKIELTHWRSITRVPGGWVIESILSNQDESAISNSQVFVPFDNEFKPLPDNHISKGDGSNPMSLGESGGV